MRALALAAIAILTFTGCVKVIGVKVDGPVGRPEFSTSKPNKACVSSVDIIADGKPFKAFWRIRSVGSCRRLNRLVYGMLPAGFAEEAPAEPLDPAKSHVISIQTSSGNGLAAFVFDGARYRLAD